jgi:hypothetical protein
MLYRGHFAWAGFELTTLVAIGTNSICSYKSNYHTIMTTTVPCYIIITLIPFQIYLIIAMALWVRTQLRRSDRDTTLCDKVCQWPATGRWFSPGPPVTSTNKTEILLKVAQSIINLNLWWCCAKKITVHYYIIINLITFQIYLIIAMETECQTTLYGTKNVAPFSLVSRISHLFISRARSM